MNHLDNQRDVLDGALLLLTVAIYPVAWKSKELAYFFRQKIMNPPLRIEIIIKLPYALASAVSSPSLA